MRRACAASPCVRTSIDGDKNACRDVGEGELRTTQSWGQCLYSRRTPCRILDSPRVGSHGHRLCIPGHFNAEQIHGHVKTRLAAATFSGDCGWPDRSGSTFSFEKRRRLTGAARCAYRLLVTRQFCYQAIQRSEYKAGNSSSSRSPGTKSRWSMGKDLSWEPLRLELVAEVAYEHMQSGRFRPIAQFRRWRFDNKPKDCTYQLHISTGGGCASKRIEGDLSGESVTSYFFCFRQDSQVYRPIGRYCISVPARTVQAKNRGRLP